MSLVDANAVVTKLLACSNSRSSKYIVLDPSDSTANQDVEDKAAFSFRLKPLALRP